MTDDELDELLYRCMPAISGAIIGELEAESALLPPHSFSRRYKRKKRAIIKKAEEASFGAPLTVTAHRFRLRRAVLVAVAAVIATTVTAFAAVQAYRVYVQNSRANTEVAFTDTNTAQINDSTFDIYEPEYIPSNFDLVKTTSNLDNDIGTYSLSYKNSNDNIIEYTQYSLKDLSINFTTGSLELEEISINDSPAKLYFSSEWQTLWWYDEKYCYTVMSDLDKKEVVKIANSLKLKK